MAKQPLRHHLRRQHDVPTRTAARHRRHAHYHRRHTHIRTRPIPPTRTATPARTPRHSRPAIPSHRRPGQYTPHNTRHRSQPPSRTPLQQPPHRTPHRPGAARRYIRPHHATTSTLRSHQRTCPPMVADGMEQEAQRMYPLRHLNALNTVGFKEWFSHFDGTLDRTTAIARIAKNTRVYAKNNSPGWPVPPSTSPHSMPNPPFPPSPKSSITSPTPQFPPPPDTGNHSRTTTRPLSLSPRPTPSDKITENASGVLGIPGAPIILVAFSPIRIKLIQIPLNYRLLSLCPLIRRLPQYSIYRTFILILLPEAVRISA